MSTEGCNIPPQAARLAPTLRSLADRGVYFGTSSWKYDGWLGSIYTQDRYMTRGKFSNAKFEENCLTEYAETFPTVCGDLTFYQFPSEQYWAKLFDAAPENFVFGFKVPEDITVSVWPKHARYGRRAGLQNENFVNRPPPSAPPIGPVGTAVGPVRFSSAANCLAARIRRRLPSGMNPEAYVIRRDNPAGRHATRASGSGDRTGTGRQAFLRRGRRPRRACRRQARRCIEAPRHFDPAHAGQREIEEHDIRPIDARRLDRRPAHRMRCRSHGPRT